jgi:hypothetical protein
VLSNIAFDQRKDLNLEEITYFVHLDTYALTIKISLADISTESTTQLNYEETESLGIVGIIDHHLTQYSQRRGLERPTSN